MAGIFKNLWNLEFTWKTNFYSNGEIEQKLFLGNWGNLDYLKCKFVLTYSLSLTFVSVCQKSDEFDFSDKFEVPTIF